MSRAVQALQEGHLETHSLEEINSNEIGVLMHNNQHPGPARCNALRMSQATGMEHISSAREDAGSRNRRSPTSAPYEHGMPRP